MQHVRPRKAAGVGGRCSQDQRRPGQSSSQGDGGPACPQMLECTALNGVTSSVLHPVTSLPYPVAADQHGLQEVACILHACTHVQLLVKGDLGTAYELLALCQAATASITILVAASGHRAIEWEPAG